MFIDDGSKIGSDQFELFSDNGIREGHVLGCA